MKKYRVKKEYSVTVLETENSNTYLVDTIVETKQSFDAIINRFLKKYPECYRIEVKLRD